MGQLNFTLRKKCQGRVEADQLVSLPILSKFSADILLVTILGFCFNNFDKLFFLLLEHTEESGGVRGQT